MKHRKTQTNSHFLFSLFQVFSIVVLFCSARSLAKEHSSFGKQLDVMRNVGWLSDNAVSDLQAEFARHYEHNDKLFENCMEYRNNIVKCNGSLKPKAGETRESQCEEKASREKAMKASEAKYCKLFIDAFEKNVGVNADNGGKLKLEYNQKCHANSDGKLVCSENINSRSKP